MSNDDPPSGFDRPDRIVDLWIEAWNQRNADQLAALFDEDAEFVNVTGLWWHDRAAIRRAHEYGLRIIFDQSTLTLLRRRVTWIVGGPDTEGPAAAVVHAKMKLTGQTAVADADEPGPRRTIFSFVVHRTDNGWRCASAQNTDVVSGTETNVADPSGRLRPVSYRSSAKGSEDQPS